MKVEKVTRLVLVYRVGGGWYIVPDLTCHEQIRVLKTPFPPFTVRSFELSGNSILQRSEKIGIKLMVGGSVI